MIMVSLSEDTSKAFGEIVTTNKRERRDFYMMKEKKEFLRHMPPHERRALMHVEFDESDWNLLREIFGDEDTAVAAAEIIREAPPEIQILTIQLMNLIEEVN